MSIKIGFCDQYYRFDPEGFSLFRFLREKFGVVLSDNPDYLIVGPYGFDHLKRNCVKIFWTGESVVPDFNLFDYAIGFDHLTFGDRYLRVPLYPLRDEFDDFRNGKNRPLDSQLVNRDFCSFVVSNAKGDPIRTEFFEALSKYKQVSSGGRYLNNIGGAVDDKRSFTAQHKFAITFENAAAPGYVTEKIMEAHAVWSVPVYWGDPSVETDFNPESFVWVKDRSSFKEAIEEIEFLDQNEQAYLKKCKCQPLVHPDVNHYWNELERFFSGIFSQGPQQARRLMSYGCQAVTYRPSIINAFADYERNERKRLMVKNLRQKLGRIKSFVVR